MVIREHLLDIDRRRQFVILERLGIDDDQSGSGGKPKAAIAGFPPCRLVLAVGFAALHAIAFAIGHVMDAPGATFGHCVEFAPLDAVDAPIATDPEILRVIFQDAIDQVVKKTFLASESDEPPILVAI